MKVNQYTTQNKFCISYKHVRIFILVGKTWNYNNYNVYSGQLRFCSPHKYLKYLEVCLLLYQRLLEELKTSNTQKLEWILLKFNNYWLYLVITIIYIQWLVPK